MHKLMRRMLPYAWLAAAMAGVIILVKQIFS